VRFGDAPGEAEKRSPRVAIPVRRSETHEGGHEGDAAAVGHARGEARDIIGARNERQTIAQPLNGGAGHEHGTLEAVGAPCLGAPAHRGDETARRRLRGATDVHEQKAAGPVGVLRLATQEAALTERRRLLVAGDSGDRDGAAEDAFLGFGDDAGRVDDPGQNGARDSEGTQQIIVPLHGFESHEKCAAGVRDIGDVGPPAAESPHEERIHRAERDFAPPSPCAQPGNCLQQVGDFCR
jgi:hypothetical protein